MNQRDDVSFDFGQAMERMRRLRTQISPNDSARRFADMGVDVFFGQGSFDSDHTINVTRADGTVSALKFRKAVIATGARAAAPFTPIQLRPKPSADLATSTTAPG